MEIHYFIQFVADEMTGNALTSHSQLIFPNCLHTSLDERSFRERDEDRMPCTYVSLPIQAPKFQCSPHSTRNIS